MHGGAQRRARTVDALVGQTVVAHFRKQKQKKNVLHTNA